MSRTILRRHHDVLTDTLMSRAFLGRGHDVSRRHNNFFTDMWMGLTPLRRRKDLAPDT